MFDLSDRKKSVASLVAGCIVNRGSIKADEKFRLMRDGEPVFPGLVAVTSIRRHRLEVQTVGKGTDCGVALSQFAELVKPGDVLQCVTFVSKPAPVIKLATGGARVVAHIAAIGSTAAASQKS